MQGSQDKVSALPFETRMMVAGKLLDSVDYAVLREELRLCGVGEDGMPSDASFRSYRQTEEYRSYHGLRLQRHAVALEAAEVEAHLVNQEAVLQARLQDVLLARLAAGALSDAACLRVWEGLQKERWRELNEDRAQQARRRLDEAPMVRSDRLMGQALTALRGCMTLRELGDLELATEFVTLAREMQARSQEGWDRYDVRRKLRHAAAGAGDAGDEGDADAGEDADATDGGADATAADTDASHANTAAVAAHAANAAAAAVAANTAADAAGDAARGGGARAAVSVAGVRVEANAGKSRLLQGGTPVRPRDPLAPSIPPVPSRSQMTGTPPRPGPSRQAG